MNHRENSLSFMTKIKQKNTYESLLSYFVVVYSRAFVKHLHIINVSCVVNVIKTFQWVSRNYHIVIYYDCK